MLLEENEDPAHSIEREGADDGASPPPPTERFLQDSTPDGGRAVPAEDNHQHGRYHGGDASGDQHRSKDGKAGCERNWHIILQLHGEPFQSIDEKCADDRAAVVARTPDDDHHPNGERHGGGETRGRRDISESYREEWSGEDHVGYSPRHRRLLVGERVFPPGPRGFPTPPDYSDNTSPL